MSPLKAALEEYLQIRQRLGFALKSSTKPLHDFVAFIEKQGAGVITTALALRWVQQPVGVHPVTRGARLTMVRQFARHRQADDPRTEVPPPGLFPQRYPRQPPYIYSNEEIRRLLEAAADLPSPRGLRGLTYATLFGLLAVSGLRVSEAVALDKEDADLTDGVLTVRGAKSGQTRLVPVHASTRRVLRDYGRRRDAILPELTTPAFFVSEHRRRVTDCSTRYNFALVSRQIGLRAPTERHRHGQGPRLHDLRHCFAARTLVDWYRAGCDVEREMPKLSAYLGHVHVNDTYWYLEAVPELLELATARVTGEDRETPA